MSGPRWCGSRRSERTTAALGDYSNGYVETDPTGRYGRFDELLGKGAMKSVYRGFDEVRGVEVAWNQANLGDVLRTPDGLQRMYSEVHLLSTLRHDAIIAFHASWVDASRRTFNFITELFSSGTLRAYRLRYPRVSLRAVKAWARQILRGLAYLHSHDPPVIHRDLKCDNIFVNGHQGQVKIGDLGLAAMLRGSRAAHSVIGTPEFMAPELYEEEYNELVDVYSFGMCMLEMLTTEYPYSECTNPAQIYKKVTSGKLPDAFYRVQGKEAHRFIGRCLVAASKRPSAEELLLDPFLSLQEQGDHAPTSCAVMPLPAPTCSNTADQSDGSCDLSSHDHDGSEEEAEQPPARTDMTITGKLNSEDDTIFLKVQIADEAGHVRNIYFPFDIVGDTAMEVANEMVSELDITDRDPSEIAAMIEREIARLVPSWLGGDQQECYTYADDDDENEHPPLDYLSSSPTSSQGYLCGVGPSASASAAFSGPHGGHCGWFQDYCCYPLSSDEDDMSSTHSALRYCSAGSDEEEEEEEEEHPQRPSSSKIKVTRFGPEESSSPTRADQPQPLPYRTVLQRQCSMSPHAGRPRHRGDDQGRGRRRMARNRSMVDMRSQLLHRTLVEELNKRLFFNTVGAVENIGFRRVPCYGDDHRRRTKDKHHYMF